MKEAPEPKFLKHEGPELSPERAEKSDDEAERAIESTKDLVESSASTLSRAKEKIDGLRESPTRSRLENRQTILSGRLSGFRKKAVAMLAGLALAVGVARGGEGNPEAASDDAVPTSDGLGAERHQAARERLERFGQALIDAQTAIEGSALKSPAPDQDPFDPAYLERIQRERQEEEAQEKAMMEDEAYANASYAELTVEEWAASEEFARLMRPENQDELFKKYKEKADEIGADEREFSEAVAKAFIAKRRAVLDKMEAAPNSLTPDERRIADELLRERELANAKGSEMRQEDGDIDGEATPG